MDDERLDNLRCVLEAEMPVGESTSIHRSVTGEPYVCLTTGGIKPEGEAIERWSASEDKAVQLFIDEFHKYRESVGGGTLYWRWPPTMQRRENGFFCVSSRLLISQKPVVVLEHA